MNKETKQEIMEEFENSSIIQTLMVASDFNEQQFRLIVKLIPELIIDKALSSQLEGIREATTEYCQNMYNLKGYLPTGQELKDFILSHLEKLKK